LRHQSETNTTENQSFVEKHILQSLSVGQENLQVVDVTRVSAVSAISDISGSVLGKRSDLDSTVESLVSHVDKAIEEGCEVVQHTSLTANKVLRDITTATESMRNASYSSIDSFTTVMDGQGDTLCSGLGNHFAALSDSLASEDAILSGVKSAIETHVEEFDGLVVVSTGTTPTKTRFDELPSLTTTRSHELIKEEARTNRSRAVVKVRSFSGDSVHSATSLEDIAPGLLERAEEKPSSDTKKRKAQSCPSVGSENANPQVPEESLPSTKVSRAKSLEVSSDAVAHVPVPKVSKIARGRGAAN
jgi:hypothetical protein